VCPTGLFGAPATLHMSAHEREAECRVPGDVVRDAWTRLGLSKDGFRFKVMMKQNFPRAATLGALAFGILLTACATPHPYTGDKETSRRRRAP
jgi:hypothetical protein